MNLLYHKLLTFANLPLALDGVGLDIMQRAIEPAKVDDAPLQLTESAISIADKLDNLQFRNLIKLVENKAMLLKKSLNTEHLTIYRDHGKIHFDWGENIDTAVLKQFCKTLVAFIRKAKRVYYIETEITNERYSMRVWLLQLGFVGDASKELRKAMLQRLEGNSAYRV